MFSLQNQELRVLYLSFRPGPPLNELVDHFWLIEGAQAPRLEKILPSGTNELVVNLKNNEIHIHDVDQPERLRRFSGAVLSGTYSRSFVCNALQHEAMMGVHFRPGGAFPFLGTEASELTNTHANLADLWGRPGLELHERLCTAATSQQRFRIMEEALSDRLDYHRTCEPQMKIALKMFACGGNGASVRDVAQELGLSQRRFIQMFNSHVGLTPKVFCRIQRFQRARVLAEELATPHWAELAAACGYFDQSHLIKDFQEFAGSTPRMYSVQQHHKDARLKDNHVPLRDE
ncbi:MAG TPA: helix-turn-helix transcriptional regulator [Pyrinomonadaceae bacterium]|nr:helix-turn-helix transcriptional regulator [Pyrinomonadaceae bacterium]